MEMKMWEWERDQLTSSEEEHNNNKGEDRIHTIVFTAGTFLLMVCLKKFLVEQWRAWVFLLLNLILLAILFMSMKPFQWGQKSESEESKVEEEELVKSDKKGKGNNNPCGGSQDENEETKQCCKNQCWSTTSTNVEIEEEEEEEHAAALSKEELNERVEAFIAMFRQHLISDVKQGESFRISKTANLTPNKIEVSCC